MRFNDIAFITLDFDYPVFDGTAAATFLFQFSRQFRQFCIIQIDTRDKANTLTFTPAALALETSYAMVFRQHAASPSRP